MYVVKRNFVKKLLALNITKSPVIKNQSGNTNKKGSYSMYQYHMGKRVQLLVSCVCLVSVKVISMKL